MGNPSVHQADQRDWLQITLSSIGDGVITTDASGRVNYLNLVAEEAHRMEACRRRREGGRGRLSHRQ